MVHRCFVVALVASVALMLAAPVSAEMVSPPGVPDLSDPDLRDQLRLVAVSALGGDPDFPVLVLERVKEKLTEYLLVILDARNGKETWSLLEDHPILFVVFSDAWVVRYAYLDEGFVADRTPSGKFVIVGPDEAEELVNKLRENHQRPAKLII